MHFPTLASILLLATTALAELPHEAARIGVGLQGKDDQGALTFVMLKELLLRGEPDTFDIVEPTFYETLELHVGSQFPQLERALRCQVKDLHGTPLFVTRGTNRDTTFSDSGNGRWKIETPSQISSIVCDPRFTADNRPL